MKARANEFIKHFKEINKGSMILLKITAYLCPLLYLMAALLEGSAVSSNQFILLMNYSRGCVEVAPACLLAGFIMAVIVDLVVRHEIGVHNKKD